MKSFWFCQKVAACILASGSAQLRGNWRPWLGKGFRVPAWVQGGSIAGEIKSSSTGTLVEELVKTQRARKWWEGLAGLVSLRSHVWGRESSGELGAVLPGFELHPDASPQAGEL